MASMMVKPTRSVADFKMRSIEAGRALAALSVVLMHCANLMNVEHFSGHIGMGGIFDFGYVGVDFFFVLSGFIIAFVHFRDIGMPASIPRYLWRRLTRIYPIFWVVLLLFILATAGGRLFLGKAPGIQMSVEDFINTVLLIKVAGGELKFVGVAWTLQFEVMFYAAFCVLLVHRIGGMLFLATWACLVIVHVLHPDFIPDSMMTNAHCLEFIMGIGVALLTRSRSFPGMGFGALAIAVLVLVLAVVYEMTISPALHGPDGRIALGVAASVLIFCLVELEKKSMLKTPRWLYMIGSVSYSIYLSHILFISLIFSVLAKAGLYHRLPEALVFAVAFLGSVFCAYMLGVMVELPLVSRLKSMFDRRLAVSPT
jgi:peptidoglycan/LPS O-acetylase OafA/YrhL